MWRPRPGIFLLHLPLAAAQQLKDPPLPVWTQGDPFVLGLALIPGVNATLLANLSASYGGMCNSSFQDYLVRWPRDSTSPPCRVSHWVTVEAEGAEERWPCHAGATGISSQCL